MNTNAASAATYSAVNDSADAPDAHWVLTLSCIDGPGIVHAISGAVVAAGGNIDESQQFTSADTGRFFMRLQVSVALGDVPASAPRSVPPTAAAHGAQRGVEAIDQSGSFETRFAEALAPVTERYGMTWRLDAVGRPVRTLLLASTATHCVNDLLYRRRTGQLPIEVPLILSNHETVRDIAEFYGVPFEYRPIAGSVGKAAFEARVQEAIEEHDIELVVLARYMQIFSPELCEALSGKAINIHHSFLPGFKGANPYRQAHARGVKQIGATAHFVTSDLDEGPIIEQDVIRVDHTRSPQELMAIGQDAEVRTLRQAVSWFAQSRVLLDGHRTIVFR